MKDDGLYLAHMLECILNIEEDLGGRRERLETNRTVRDAVMHNLQLLGQSSKRVSEETKARHPELPWRDMGDFRNVVVHDYLEINYDEVWNIIETNLPPLKEQLLKIAPQRPHS